MSSTDSSTDEHFEFPRPIRRVCVVGAGAAGLPAARHLRDRGIEVRVFERQSSAGGIWNYRPEPGPAPSFPSVDPSQADFVPELPPQGVQLPYTKFVCDDGRKWLEHAPPNATYESLRNNIATPLTELQNFPWPKGTEWYTGHENILQYLKRYPEHFGMQDCIEYNTRVERIDELPDNEGWKVWLQKLEQEGQHHEGSVNHLSVTWWTETFDAVLVAAGNYRTPFIPDMKGLKHWFQRFPEAFSHSKAYRVPKPYVGKTVLIIGLGISGYDISRDLHANGVKKVYVATRELPPGPPEYRQLREYLHTDIRTLDGIVEVVEQVEEFLPFECNPKATISQGKVKLAKGRIITGIDYVIFATGYQFSIPFLPHLHQDPSCPPEKRRPVEELLITDGKAYHNLYRDIFFIPNPTLALVGVNINIPTFSFFEYQGIVAASVWSGKARLPTQERQRELYEEAVSKRGVGRLVHVMGGDVMLYIDETVEWLNEDAQRLGGKMIEGYSEEFREVWRVQTDKWKALNDTDANGEWHVEQ